MRPVLDWRRHHIAFILLCRASGATSRQHVVLVYCNCCFRARQQKHACCRLLLACIVGALTNLFSNKALTLTDILDEIALLASPCASRRSSSYACGLLLC